MVNILLSASMDIGLKDKNTCRLNHSNIASIILLRVLRVPKTLDIVNMEDWVYVLSW